jgi:hypothetical protein
MLCNDILVIALDIIIVMWYSDVYLIIHMKKSPTICSFLRVPIIVASYLLDK